MRQYRARWQAVAEIERQERLTLTIQQRWLQLNSILGLAVGLGIMMPDQSEAEVYQRWAKLKNQADSRTQGT